MGRFLSILEPKFCLLAQVFNSSEFLKGGIFCVIAMYAFLALILVDVHLSHPLFLERKVCGFSTKNVLGVVNHEVTKNVSKQAHMFLLALDL